MKHSIVIGPGIWQYEFTGTAIAVAQWDEPPTSTLQWVRIVPGEYGGLFRLEGTCNEDIKVTPWIVRNVTATECRARLIERYYPSESTDGVVNEEET